MQAWKVLKNDCEQSHESGPVQAYRTEVTENEQWSHSNMERRKEKVHTFRIGRTDVQFD